MTQQEIINTTNGFEEYKSIHNFMHPDEPLKSWINESNYTNSYNSSWDYLIPVVTKFLSIPFLDFCTLAKLDLEQDTLREALMSAEIDEVYTTLLEGIKWYNTQP